MTNKRALELLDKHETNYDKKQRFVRGVVILAKYDNNIDPSFEHDITWLCDFNETIKKMTEEDLIKLAECGFFEDEEAWSCF